MLGKLVWKIKTQPNSLVARVLKARYFQNKDLFDAELGNNPSYVWRSIHAAKDLVRMGARWKLGDGKSVHIWGDPWLDSNRSFYISTPVVPGFSDIVVGDLYTPYTRQCDEELIMGVFNQDDSSRIMHTIPASNSNNDKMVWHFTSDGGYSVKTAYHMACRLIEGVHDYEDSPWRAIWRVRDLPKVKSFFWRLCKGWVAVRSKLRRWYNTMEATCLVCDQGPETIWHLFVDCEHAREFWRAGNLWHKIDTLCYSVDGATDLFLALSRHLERDEMERAMMIAWAIWMGRNNLIWNAIDEAPGRQVYSAMATLAEWQSVRPLPGSSAMTSCCSKWHAPCLGFIKVNVDAAFFEDSLETGIGMIIHDDEGEFICCRSLVRTGVLKVEEGEAWGIVKAIRWVIALGFDKVIIESDSMRAIEALKAKDYGNVTLGDYVKEGVHLLGMNENFLLGWVHRSANTLTHNIARASRDYNSPHCWVEPPTFVDGLLDSCISCV